MACLLARHPKTIRKHGVSGELATCSRAALRLLCVRLGEVQSRARSVHSAGRCLSARCRVYRFEGLVSARACPSRQHRRPVASRSARVLREMVPRILPGTQARLHWRSTGRMLCTNSFRIEECYVVLCACGCEISNSSVFSGALMLAFDLSMGSLARQFFSGQGKALATFSDSYVFSDVLNLHHVINSIGLAFFKKKNSWPRTSTRGSWDCRSHTCSGKKRKPRVTLASSDFSSRTSQLTQAGLIRLGSLGAWLSRRAGTLLRESTDDSWDPS